MSVQVALNNSGTVKLMKLKKILIALTIAALFGGLALAGSKLRFWIVLIVSVGSCIVLVWWMFYTVFIDKKPCWYADEWADEAMKHGDDAVHWLEQRKDYYGVEHFPQEVQELNLAIKIVLKRQNAQTVA